MTETKKEAETSFFISLNRFDYPFLARKSAMKSVSAFTPS